MWEYLLPFSIWIPHTCNLVKLKTLISSQTEVLTYRGERGQEGFLFIKKIQQNFKEKKALTCVKNVAVSYNQVPYCK